MKRGKTAIVFAHNFTKLHNQKTAKLLHVDVRRNDQLDLKTVELDTAYEVETTKPPATPGEEAPVVKQTKYCDLPKGTVLLLVFIGDRDIPFTTYRKYSQRSWEKFEKMAVKKEKFDIVLNETAN